MDLNARVDLNCGRKDGLTDRWKTRHLCAKKMDRQAIRTTFDNRSQVCYINNFNDFTKNN